VTDQLTNDLESLKIPRGESAPPPSHAFRRTIVVLAVLGGLGYGAMRWYPYLAAQVFKTTVRTAEISVVSPAQASTTLTAAGYVIPQVLSHVAPRTAGRVLRVAVHEGQAVAANQLLLELDGSDQRTSIAAARARALAAAARVAAARANLAEIRVQADRQRVLVARGVVPRSTVEDLDARIGALQAAVTAAQADVSSARADVEVQRVGLEHVTLNAPIAGTILNRPPEVGEMLSPQASVMDIADMSSLVVEVDVPEARLQLARPGSPCEIVLDAFPGRRLRGATLEVGRRVDRARATVPVKVRFVDPSDGVLPNMAARVSFLTEALSTTAMRGAERMVVPRDAVMTRGSERYVFVVEDGTVRQRTVRVGGPLDTGIELLDGPLPRAHVVLHPPATLRDGQRVRETTQ